MIERTMPPTPTNIRASQEDGELEITWSDGIVHRLPFKYVRSQCPCAKCVDEMTGRRTLDAGSIPETIKPLEITFSGNYALKIAWNDGHDTGLYTWELLEKLGRDQRMKDER